MSYDFTNQEKSILTELWKSTLEGTQKCYNPGCNNDSIRSHIQQAKGPLSSIASNGEVIQLQYHFPRLHKSLYLSPSEYPAALLRLGGMRAKDELKVASHKSIKK